MTFDPELGPLYLTIPQAAKKLGVGKDLVYALVREGDLKVTTMGSRRLIGRLTLQRFEEEHQGDTLLPNGTRPAAAASPPPEGDRR